ncbi:uncharacterized protein LOC104443978 [Eucalyptus grandis]|uniref:uncharacterized protein LOC104443978 n=1 Tax=Eucalyptus grandis TaxID=71139 RepID=UPI0008A0E882|nr:uncharacterized protein LOC104443978 [Eucalyptus grandis]
MASRLWDCESTLYDSFELRSFKRALDSAIVSRSLSMPHFPDRRGETPGPPLPQPPSAPPPTKKGSKISRSLHRLLRSVFKPNKPIFGVERHEALKGNFLFFYDKSGALSTIPEVPESECFAALSPEVSSFVQRTASERFTAASAGISCA